MIKLEVRLRHSPADSRTVGHLAEHQRRIYFEYSSEFVRSGVSLAPFKLPLREGLIEHDDRRFGPLPGLFEDSLPDGWGRLLMDRDFRRRGFDPAHCSPLQRLAWIGGHGMGALTYHPALNDGEAAPINIDLAALSRQANAVLRGDAGDVLPALIRTGGSPAGARPKVLVGFMGDEVISGEDDLPDGFAHWMVKFPGVTDGRGIGAIEFAYARMAAAAGVVMSRTRLIELGPARRYFAVQRFDRLPGNRRLHLQHLASLLHADFRIPSLDYSDLLRVTSALTRNHQDVLRAYRLMLFNVAAHNRDDHAKNFAFLMDAQGQWTLSPAYDLVPSDGPGGEHSTSIQGEGREPGRSHCLALAEAFGIKREHACAAIDAVNASLRRWSEFADEAGCPRRHADVVRKKFREI